MRRIAGTFILCSLMFNHWAAHAEESSCQEYTAIANLVGFGGVKQLEGADMTQSMEVQACIEQGGRAVYSAGGTITPVFAGGKLVKTVKSQTFFCSCSPAPWYDLPTIADAVWNGFIGKTWLLD